MGKVATSPPGERESMWIVIAPALRRSVAGSAGANEIDDLIQDVAERFLAKTSEFASEAKALAWARMVARNRLIDRSRRPRSTSLADREIPSRVDAERSALDRMALDCARSFLGTLGVTEHWLAGEVRGPVTAKERMQRSRIRRKLADHLKDKVGWSVLVPRWRWLVPALGAASLIPIPFVASLTPPAPSADPAPVHRDGTPDSGNLSYEAARTSSQLDEPVVRPTPPTPSAAPRGQADPIVTVPLPWGGARVREEPTPPGASEPLACVENLRPVPEVCLEHPLK